MATKSKAAGGRNERLMSLPELANYLHLTQKTALKLAAAKKVPGVLVDKQWRFKRSEVDAWLSEQLTGESEIEGDDALEDVPDGMRVPLADLLPDEAIIGDLRTDGALGIIEELAARAYSNNWLADKPWFVGAVVERESLASTAMEGGVAFLHTRARDQGKIARPFIIAGRSYQGIDFGAPDGKPTYLFFLLGLKYDTLHLPILGRLARAMRNPKTVARLRSMTSIPKIRSLLLEEDERARSQIRPAPVAYEHKPKLDKQMRLRTIMRLTAQRRHDEKKQAKADAKTARGARSAAKKTAARKAAASSGNEKTAAKKSAATAKKAPTRTRKSTATAKKSPTTKSASTAKKTPTRKSTAAASKTSTRKSASTAKKAPTPTPTKTKTKTKAKKSTSTAKKAPTKTRTKKSTTTAKKSSSSKKPTAKKSTAKKSTAKKSTAKKSTTTARRSRSKK